MSNRMKVYIMMQTHTDIGYTDRQEKITRYHIDYLKQAITYSEAIADGSHPEWKGFVWNNESFWIIDKFLKNTDVSWHKRLEAAIKRNHIQVTGNYLNLTDLVDSKALEKQLAKVKNFGEKVGVKINSAVSMDINGWSWGYSQLLYNAGIRRFYTCIHNHHGFVPFKRKHNPFYWKTPHGNKILVWNGDVYNQGNVSRLTPDVEGVVEDGKYMTKVHISEEQLQYAKEWLDDYIESVSLQGYSYDFIPIMTKGILVDNAPANPYIMESIRVFNEKYGKDYELEMIGINDFFDMVESLNLDLPEYEGDWTDWWSDGFMSSPKAVKLYRDAQKQYRQILEFKDMGAPVNEEKLEALEDNMMCFAEHTWGYFTSVSEPWNKMTTILDSRNEWFASSANKLAYELMDDICEHHGEFMKAIGRPLRYKVVNPYGYDKYERIKVYVNWWDEYLVKEGYEVIDEETGEMLTHQEILVDEKSRKQINFNAIIKANSSKVFVVKPKAKRQRRIALDPLFTRDTRYDYISPYLSNEVIASQFKLETPYVRINWERDLGITSWFDKADNVELIRSDKIQNMLTPIYEITSCLNKYQFAQPEIKEIRANFGRNRKIISSERHEGKLINVRVLSNGPLFGRVELKYEMPGSIYTTVMLTAYADEPRVDVSFILGKETVWEPESVYLALPISAGSEKDVLWLDKMGQSIRPRVDQLPGTLIKFYTAHKGLMLVNEERGLVVTTQDSPIVYMGSLHPGEIEFKDENSENNDILYSWNMNNYWETNFATSLGGFYEYKYIFRWGKDLNNVEDSLRKLEDLYYELPTFQCH